MSKDNWYDSESWYKPLYGEPEEKKTETPAKAKKKKRRWLRAAGIVCLAVAVLVGSSLIFRDKDAASANKSGGLPSLEEDLPGSFREFFANYYESTATNTAEVNIRRAPVPIDYELKLSPAPEEELSLQELYDKCSPSVVGITGTIDGRMGYNWGTGIILTQDGLIITNTHVIEKCDKATVTLYDDTEYEAWLVGADSISDVAVLKIDAKNLPAAEFGESAGLSVGEHVAAIGNPLGEEFRMTLTDGIVSAIERGVSYQGRSMTLIQTNTALNEGNSGGPLFNMYGQVVGITNMKMMSSYSSIEGIGFAIPTSTVRSVVNALLAEGEVRGRPSIGIVVGGIPETAAKEYDLPEGLYISEVSKGSDAEAKGLREGDIILAVNGQAVTTTAEVAAIRDQFKVGDSLRFTIWRDGETFDVSVKLVDTNDIYG